MLVGVKPAIIRHGDEPCSFQPRYIGCDRHAVGGAAGKRLSLCVASVIAQNVSDGFNKCGLTVAGFLAVQDKENLILSQPCQRVPDCLLQIGGKVFVPAGKCLLFH